MNCWRVLFVCSTFVTVISTTNKVLFKKKEGVYLTGSLIQQVQANSEFECGAFCSKEPNCQSVNFKVAGKGRRNCELNSGTLQEDSSTNSNQEKCVMDPEWIYLEMVKKDNSGRVRFI